MNLRIGKSRYIFKDNFGNDNSIIVGGGRKISEECDYIEIQESINGLIYDYLNPHNYQIKIIPINENNIDKYIYLKIQSDKALNNEFDLNNGIIDFHPYYPFGNLYFNSPFNKGNNGDGCPGNDYDPPMNPPYVIEKILSHMLNIFDILYIKEVDKKYYDYHLIERPPENSIYNISSHYETKNGKILFRNLYIYYINSKNGFFSIIINKYKFNWNCVSTIKYLADSKKYYLYFKIGTFILNEGLKIYSIDFSSNLFSSIKFKLINKLLDEIADIIKDSDLKEKEEINDIIIKPKIEQEINGENLQLLSDYSPKIIDLINEDYNLKFNYNLTDSNIREKKEFRIYGEINELGKDIYSSYITCENKRGNIGKIYSYMIKGSDEGRVWGYGIYSDDSNIAKAAVLDGKCNLGEYKTVFIKIIEGQSSYLSYSKNGINSSSWGSWPGSYKFV